MDDQPKIDLCSCGKFVLWYAERKFEVCRCGHERAEHLDGDKSCVGEIDTRTV